MRRRQRSRVRANALGHAASALATAAVAAVLAVLAAVLAVLAVVVAPAARPSPGVPAAAAAVHRQRAPRVVTVYATYYGWFTNTPPGCATAYSGCARGTGTYADPITFASDKKEFPVGTILYYPTVEKYFVMGDECTECTADWKGKGPDGGPHLHHIDLWIGGKGANEFDVINCEDALTQGSPSGRPLLTPFVADPPGTLPVSTEPLFDSRSNHCYGGATTSATYGRYQNKRSKQCLEDPGDSTTPGTPAAVAACSGGPSEEIAFDGAFFVAHGLCLQTEGAKVGSQIDFATCNGDDKEQWEIGRRGTVAWIQYRRCVAETKSRILVLGKCTARDDDLWSFTAEKQPSSTGTSASSSTPSSTT